MSDTRSQASTDEGQSELTAVVVRRSTPFFGWKGSIGIGVAWFLGAIFVAPTASEAIACIGGLFGWFGWALQERQHLNDLEDK